MSIERRILVEFKKEMRGRATSSCDDMLKLLDKIEREIVNADDTKNKENALNALTSAFSNPDVLKSLLEG